MFLFLFRIRHRGFSRGSWFVDAVEIYLAQWLVLLLRGGGKKFVGTVILRSLRTLLLLRFLQLKFFSLRPHLLVLLELTHESLILLIVEFEARLRFHFAQFTSFLKELHCRLESYVQFT